MFSIWGLIYKELKKHQLKKNFRSRQILLSFDDGPDSIYTSRLLDLLKQKEVKAVFFVVAEKAARHPSVIARMKIEGHRIEYHSSDHRKIFYLGPKAAKKYIENGLHLLHAQGISASYFRPPWGMLTPFYFHAVKKAGLKLCFWSCMAQDWRARSKAAEIKDRLLRRTIDGGFVCLHDSGEDTGGAPGAPARMLDALSGYIDSRRACGYEFITFEEAEERGLLS